RRGGLRPAWPAAVAQGVAQLRAGPDRARPARFAVPATPAPPQQAAARLQGAPAGAPARENWARAWEQHTHRTSTRRRRRAPPRPGPSALGQLNRVNPRAASGHSLLLPRGAPPSLSL